jgi:HAAS domain-containing protein
MMTDGYLRRVDVALRDLPWGMRHELVAELRGHLAELSTDTDLASLGTPEEYAAQLRSAAGLERRRGPIAFLRARRPRNVVLVVVALALLGFAIGTVRWVDGYQPLAFSGYGLLPDRASATPTGDGSLVVFHEGGRFKYGVSVVNTGRFAVRLLGVPEPPIRAFSARLFLSKPGELATPPRRHAVPYMPFRPFDLQPGEQRLLVLRGVYHATPALCHSGLRWGGAKRVEFPVRFSFLWKTATVQIRHISSALRLTIIIHHRGGRSVPLRGCR